MVIAFLPRSKCLLISWLHSPSAVILEPKKIYIYGAQEKIYAEYIMRNAGLDETQAAIKIAWRNSNNLRYADD